MEAKDVQKRLQGHPFGQQKLTKLVLDHGCENMAPVQKIGMFSLGGTFQIPSNSAGKASLNTMRRGAFSEEVSGVSFWSILLILGNHLGSVWELWGHRVTPRIEQI